MTGRVRAPQLALRSPSPALRAFASRLWWSAAPAAPQDALEHVLPTGQMHLVFRLAGPPLCVLDGQGRTIIGEPVIGGARTSFYAKESCAPVVSVGVQLLPGAARALFGPSAADFADAHTPLSAVWGGDAARALETIAAAGDPQRQLATLDALLCARIRAGRALQAPLRWALQQLAGGEARIDTLARDSGYSHRGFIALFREAAGMSPKRYARVQRFQQALAALQAGTATLAELAVAAGYSDQAHMTREFQAMAGLSPGAYRGLAPAAAHHVAIPQGPAAQVKFVQDRARSAGL